MPDQVNDQDATSNPPQQVVAKGGIGLPRMGGGVPATAPKKDDDGE